MNQYNNKCEVLSSKDIKLYSSPFPIHPIIFLKNSNYAKKIKMYETDYQNNVNLDLDPSSASAGIIIAGTILSAVPGLTIPGAIIISFGTLLPILWPGGANDISIFNAMINNMETILNERINEVEKQRAFATLEGFRLLVQNYEDALIYWNDLRQRQPPPPLHVLEAAASTLRIRFELANGSFDQNLPQLQLEDYKLLLLPTYAQAANMHLNLLHQGAQLADQWNADARRASQKEFEDKPGTSSGWYQKLIEKTPKYCNYCANTYRDGLNMLKKEPNITWDRFNTYRREMTLNVLDIASLFCNYDIYKYPIGYKSEITREVYQSLNSENNVYEHYYDIDQLDYLLTRTPNLFTCLQGLYFYQQNRDTPNNFFTSHFNTFHYINDSSIQNSAVFGDQHPTDILISLQLATDIYVFLLNVTSLDNEHLDKHNNISNIHFFITNGVRLLEKHLKAGPGEITDPINKNTFGLPPIRKAPIPNYDNYSHILSFVKSINPISPHKTQVYSFAWTHISVDPDNKIYKDKTTSLPVVKANEINLPSKVIEGPGHTGGDVIQLQPQGSFKMTCRTASAEQKYFIRI
ncbi:pesticidal crystal protein cry4Aa, partial [Bacillus cereus]